MKVFVVSAMLLACVFAVPVENGNNVFKFFGQCMQSEDYSTCLAVKGLTALNRAARAANIEIIDGVSFIRDQNVPERSGKAISENEIVSSLPVDPEERSSRMMSMAMDTAREFVQTHTLQFKLPTDAPEEMARSIDEGRAKIKKLLKGPLRIILQLKVLALLPIVVLVLKVLAIKALILGKMALSMAVMMLAKKLGAAGGSNPLSFLSKVTGGSVSTASASAEYPYARNYDTAQDLAYGAHAPQ